MTATLGVPERCAIYDDARARSMSCMVADVGFQKQIIPTRLASMAL